jgi:transcriptional regulator with XRE-family HTH domain
MVLLRHMLGDALRRLRLRQGRTLREVSAAARVSLGYLSEVERGQKEASSELLASICGALGAPLSQVLREVSDSFALAELQNEPVYAGPVGPVEPALNGASGPRPAGPGRPAAPGAVPAPARGVPAGARGVPAPAGRGVPVPAGARLPLAAPRRITVRSDRSIISEPEPVLDHAQLPVEAPHFERIRDITNMVPV